jgi:D-3-phosphoglycerate dehydrogenase
METVLILDPVAPLLATELRGAGLEVQDFSRSGAKRVEESLAGAQGLVVRSRTRVTAEMIDRAPGLRVIGRAGSGTDSIDVAHAKSRGIEVLTVPGGNENAVAELVLGMMLALARHLVPAVDASRRGQWAKSKLMGFELAGETLGVIGTGRIGSRLARKALALEMRVLGSDPFADLSDLAADGLEIASMEDVLSRSRFVSVHVPLSDATRSLLGRKEFASMRRDAYLVQCSRGGVVDEDALAEALEAERLAGAALDVFAREPEFPERLARNPRVLATPHIGASTVQSQEKIAAALAGRIIGCFREGETR